MKETLGEVWDNEGGSPEPEVKARPTRKVEVSFDLCDDWLEQSEADPDFYYDEWFEAFFKGGKDALLEALRSEFSGPTSMASDFNMNAVSARVTLVEGDKKLATVYWSSE